MDPSFKRALQQAQARAYTNLNSFDRCVIDNYTTGEISLERAEALKDNIQRYKTEADAENARKAMRDTVLALGGIEALKAAFANPNHEYHNTLAICQEQHPRPVRAWVMNAKTTLGL